MALEVQVGEWQDPKEATATSAAPRTPPAANKLGLALSVPTPAQRRERGIEGGLIVDRGQGAAARAEIQQGAVIQAIVFGGRQIRLESVEEFNRLIGGVEQGQKVTLLVMRGEATSYVSLRAGK